MKQTNVPWSVSEYAEEKTVRDSHLCEQVGHTGEPVWIRLETGTEKSKRSLLGVACTVEITAQ